jgi:hypothetical protein
MTTKSEDVWVTRVTESMLKVDDIIVINQNGLWITPSGDNLGDHRIMAIFNFLNAEEERKDKAPIVAVRSLLHELNIPYQIN